MNRRVIDFIARHQMLQPGDRVIVGVSGGADSLALLHFLRFRCGMELQLTACHINHLLRGEESMRDQRHVEAICAAWQMPLVVERIDVGQAAKASGKSLEEAGREARYACFRALAGEDGKIATAHTMSDNGETLLFRLVRGTGLKGLCGIPPVRGNILRPLLCVTREEVEQYCAENGISYITDSSNNDNIYTRNKIRLDILPHLKALNPQLEQQLGRTAALLSEDSALLERLAAENRARCREGECLRLSGLSEESALRSRVLIGWLLEHGAPYDFETVDRISEIALQGYGKINIGGNFFCEAGGGLLRIYQEEAHTPAFRFPLEEGRHRMPSGIEYSFYTVKRDALPIQEIFKNSTYNYIDSEKIIGKLEIRQRRNGDKICIYPRNITKSIKKLWNEAKIPLKMREKIFLLCDERGIIYVEGFGIDRRVIPDANTEKYLVIKKEQTKNEG